MNTNPLLRGFLARAAAGCAAGAGALALAGLASWWFGHWHWAAFGREYVPMAPSTALLMLPLSAAAFLRAQPSPHRARRAMESVCALLVLGAGALFWLQFLFGLGWPVEDWLARTSETIGEIPVGRMSPLTAGCFVLAAAALRCGSVTALRWQPVRALGGWLGLAGLAVSGLVVAGYLAGTPLLYGGSTIPMALLTGVAFVLVSAATLLGAGSDAWPLRMFLRGRAPDERGAAPGVEWSLLLLCLLLAAGIIMGSARYLNLHQAEARRVAREELGVIAGLKVQQIVRWRNERLGDANVIFNTPAFAARAREFMADPAGESAHREIAGLLAILRQSYGYERVVLLDARLSPRLTLPPATETMAPACPQAREALERRQAAFTDLHRAGGAGNIHFDLVVPLLARGLPGGIADAQPVFPPEPGAPPVGVIVLQLDPRKFLFPLVQTWPTPSPSAETLLVRREGAEVLYLNELRHRQGTAMTLRRPLNEPRLPAAMGLRGESGIQEGVDYRGVRVVAAVRPVPDTPWVMVAKVDEAELYGPLRREAFAVAAMALALLLAAALGVTVLWRRRNEQFLRAQLLIEQERRALAERFEHLMNHAGDIILLTDGQQRILEANDRAVQAYGWTLAELRRQTLPALWPPELRAGLARQTESAGRGGPAWFETAHRRRDGTTFPVEVSTGADEIGGVSYRLDIVRDISQRKAHEAEIARLNRLYATLSEVNQTIVRCQSREELFADICRVAVEFGRFKTAWIGWKPAEGGALTLMAHHASGPDPALAMPGWEGGCGVMAEAVRTGRPCLCNNSHADERAVCCRQVLAPLGIQACAAFPLRLRGEVGGALGICSIDPTFFNAAEIRLLEEVTSDISFALDKLDKEEQRQSAEAALLASEVQYRRLFEAAKDGILILDAGTGMVLDVNPFLVGLLGFAREQFLGKRIWELGFFKDIVANQDNFTMLQAKEYIRYEDAPMETADGRRIEVEFSSNVYPVNHHKVIQCNIRDITESKQGAEALFYSRQMLRLILDTIPQCVFWKDRDLVYQDCNRAFVLAGGYRDPQEIIGKTDLELAWKADADRYRADDRAVMDSGVPIFNFEEPQSKPEGGSLWLKTSKMPLKDKNGRVIGILGTHEDITGLKLAGAALQRSRVDLEQAQAIAHMGSWTSEFAGRPKLAWSAETYRIFGLVPEAFDGRLETFDRLVHPDDRPAVAEEARAAWAGERAYVLEHRIVRPDGSVRWVYQQADVERDAEGNPLRMVGVIQDITERKQAEAALRESEEQFRAMFEVASIGMAQADPRTGQWLRVNQKMCAITGYSAGEMLRMHISEITHPDDRGKDWEAFQGVVRREFPEYHLETRYIRKDGGLAWVNVNMTVIRDAAGQPLRTMATVEDITVRKRLEQERWAMEAQMRQQQKLESIGTLASGVAHEINNPINGAMNYAQLILDDAAPDSRTAELAREILHETERVAAIVRNLLQFSRRESLARSPARLADIIEGTLSLIRTVIRHDQIALTVNVPGDLPDLKCRSQLLQQVLMNLMTNARDALNERYPGHDPDKVLNLEAHLFEREARRWIRVTVEDHGTGITPEVRERMFDPFFTTKPRDKGTGLGLAISHGIVKEHGGELTVETEPGRFTRMHVDLPVDTA